MEFEVTCQSDGMFTDTMWPQPVSCGEPPSKENSAFPEGASHVFTESAQYTCEFGHTVNGEAGGAKGFLVACETNGKYEESKGCFPVECGPPDVPKHAEQLKGGKKELVFSDTATFTCDPGYSTDGTMAGPTTTGTRCQATGKLVDTLKCRNMNDCEGNRCGKHGKCSDNKDPTGVHKDDYKCICDSGFEEMFEDDGSRYCGNIPDCPKGACMPGVCEDLVNDYKCHCDEGFHEGANEKAGFKHDCLPNVCGKAPQLKHAKQESGGGKHQEFNFISDPARYTCDKGYSLDGTAVGEVNFEVACQADKDFAEAPKCKPIECGKAPEVLNSKVEDKVWEFPNTSISNARKDIQLTAMQGAKSRLWASAPMRAHSTRSCRASRSSAQT